ncbi:MAG TPA: GatB/YqeY domain-containing protein, partial [Longimicrobiaceae bacterium]|nr:GatB/YqeY domain-containing protein [Longimicrobiaceae bacterium]
ALADGANPRSVSNWLVHELPREIGERTIANLPFSGRDLGSLVALVDEGTLSSSAGREVLAEMVETGGAPDAIVERRGLRQVSDPDTLRPVVAAVLTENPKKVEEYRGGRIGLLGFFMGQVMRRTGGRANPEVVKELLEADLQGESVGSPPSS